MTNPHEERARQEKVDALVPVLRERYRFIPVPSRGEWLRDDSQTGMGAQGSRPSITEWVSDPDFPWWAMERIAGVKRCSPTTREAVLASLRESEAA